MEKINKTCLTSNSCVPCNEGTMPLEIEEAKQLHMQLQKGWKIRKNQRLYKKYTFKNFRQAMNFANQVATVAEAEGHHPDLSISWGLCEIEIWTHKINGLSYNDFILASKIDEID